MNIRKYIETIIIDEHAFKNGRDGWTCNIDDIDPEKLDNVLDNFLDVLFRNDEYTRDLILDRMQTLINERLPLRDCQSKYESGLVPAQDKINGEIFWTRRGAA